MVTLRHSIFLITLLFQNLLQSTWQASQRGPSTIKTNALHAQNPFSEICESCSGEGHSQRTFSPGPARDDVNNDIAS